MSWFLDTAAVTAVLGGAGGLLVPTLVRRIPEPPEEAVEVAERDESVVEVAPGPVIAEHKETYVAIAALPGLAWRSAVAAAVVAALVGARIGWDWRLLPLMYLVPVGVALALVDWRTRLLPTKVIAPSYAAVVVLVLVAAVLDDDWTDLRRAGFGWLVAGGTFMLLWLIYPRGMGYGDVRLSGILGIALGCLGWGQLLLGVYAGFLLGGLGGTLLTLLRIVDRRAYPFGPFMLLGAVVGILWGGQVADLYLGA